MLVEIRGGSHCSAYCFLRSDFIFSNTTRDYNCYLSFRLVRNKNGRL